KVPVSGHQVLSFGLAPDGRTATSFSRIGEEFAPRSFRSVYLLHTWDLATGRVLLRRSYPSDSSSHNFSPDAKIVAGYPPSVPQPVEKTVDGKPVSSRADPTMQLILWEVATGRQLLTLPQPESS